MKVVLLKDVANVGQKYEITDVASGFALNFLIPQGMARFADEGTIKDIQKKREAEEAQQAKEAEKIMVKLEEIKDNPVTIKAKANEEGHLFAKVAEKDIADALKKDLGIDLNTSNIILEKPIKEVGSHKVVIKVGEREEEILIEIASSE